MPQWDRGSGGRASRTVVTLLVIVLVSGAWCAASAQQPITAAAEPALVSAARQGQVEAVKTLLSKETPPPAMLEMALDAARRDGYFEIVPLLRRTLAAAQWRQRFLDAALLAAVKQPDALSVETLLNGGANFATIEPQTSRNTLDYAADQPELALLASMLNHPVVQPKLTREQLERLARRAINSGNRAMLELVRQYLTPELAPSSGAADSPGEEKR